jgi:hypothetical protein
MATPMASGSRMEPMNLARGRVCLPIVDLPVRLHVDDGRDHHPAGRDHPRDLLPLDPVARRQRTTRATAAASISAAPDVADEEQALGTPGSKLAMSGRPAQRCPSRTCADGGTGERCRRSAPIAIEARQLTVWEQDQGGGEEDPQRIRGDGDEERRMAVGRKCPGKCQVEIAQLKQRIQTPTDTSTGPMAFGLPLGINQPTPT